MGIVIVQILAGMKLWLLIIGTILVYITVSNDAKRLNGDRQEGNPTSLVEDREGMSRVKRSVGGRGGKQRRLTRRGNARRGGKSRMPQIVRRKPQRAARRKPQKVA